MDLAPYVEAVRESLRTAAALADEPTQRIAEHLGSAVDAGSRLALIQALSDAAAEISADLAPGWVDVRMSGTEPSFIVTPPASDHDNVAVLTPQNEIESQDATQVVDTDEAQARITLRLPQSVKDHVDALAEADGVSTNTWLLHRVLEAVAERHRRGGGRRSAFSLSIDSEGLRFDGPRGQLPPTPSPPSPRAPFGHDTLPGRTNHPGQEPNRGAQGWVR